MSTRDLIRVRPRLGSEKGQATTEFALVLLPLLLLVSGIIWFGIGLNYWLDMQRIANQGSRWAVVNSYPGCPRTGPTTSPCSPTLQEYLSSQPIAGGLKPCVTISFPSGGTPVNGDPVQVTLTQTFNVVPIVGVGPIELKATAS